MKHAFFVVAFVLSGCGEVQGSVDGSSLDVAKVDGFADVGSVDSNSDFDTPLDTPLQTGFGEISANCGILESGVMEIVPSYFGSTLDFGQNQFDDPAERPLLTQAAQKVLEVGTAGGSSAISEAFAVEYLVRCQMAQLYKTETEVLYDNREHKKVDAVMDAFGARLGVSVTRAVSFPRADPYELMDVAFLERKVEDVQESSLDVSAQDRWDRSVVVVMADTEQHAKVVKDAWDGYPASLKGDVIMITVITEGLDDPLY